MTRAGHLAAGSRRSSAIPLPDLDQLAPISWAAEILSAFANPPEPTPGTAELLRGLWERGREAWPAFEILPLTWGRHLVRALPASGPPTTAELPSLHPEDFYLACGCALAIPQALVAFDRLYLTQLPVLLGQMRLSTAFVDEVGQVLREKLLVGVGERPARIHLYAGQGSLLGWLRVVAIRTALNLGDSQDEKNIRDNGAAEALFATLDPERALIIEQQRRELLGILRDAIRTLPAQQRKALRMQMCDGLTGDEIAIRLSVARSTVVRWLSAARVAILKETERLFRHRLDLSSAELENMVAETRSQLDLRLSILFKSAPDNKGVA